MCKNNSAKQNSGYNSAAIQLTRWRWVLAKLNNFSQHFTPFLGLFKVFTEENMSTWSWASRERLGLTMIPETLKSLSEAQLEAAMQRYLLANSWDDVPSSLPFFSPWMAESRCFKSVFDFLDGLLWLEASAPVAMGVSDVPAPSSAFPTCSRRLCFTSR